MPNLCRVVCVYFFVIRLTLVKSDSSLEKGSVDFDTRESNFGECKDFGRCSQLCVDSVKCACISGFKLSNEKSCGIVDDNATLVFAGTTRVGVLNLGKFQQNHTIPGSPNYVSYNARWNYIYWTDIDIHHNATIKRCRLDGSEMEIVVGRGLSGPRGIAYDWIGDNIYFADRRLHQIGVCSADFLFCSVLIQNKFMYPTAIALQPNQGLMFWSANWNETFLLAGSIMRAGMDGSNSIQIVKDCRPEGVAVDIGNNRIYWTDWDIDRIETVRFDGSDRRIIISGLKSPWGIDIIGDTLIWSDYTRSVIEASDKFGGWSNRVTLVSASANTDNHIFLYGLAIFHQANQPISRRNPCQDAGCSHFCIIGPANTFRCMCPVGMGLETENKTICFLTEISQCSPEPGNRPSCGFSDKDLRGSSVSRCPGNLVLDELDGTCVCPEGGLVLDKNLRSCVPAPVGHKLFLTVGVILLALTLVVLGTAFAIRKYKKRTNLKAEFSEL